MARLSTERVENSSADASTTQSEGIKLLKQMGFKSLLGWHYLVLFSPLLISSTSEIQTFYYNRQFLLFGVLALTFLVLMLLDRFIPRCQKILASRTLIVVVGVLACLTTALSDISLNMGLEIRYAVVICLGFSEALIMFVWIHYFTTLALVRPYRTLATDMIIGGVIALIIASLVEPVSLIVTACLPLIAVASLMAHRQRFFRLVTQQDEEPASSSSDVIDDDKNTKEDKSIGVRYVLKRIIPTIAFALVFGLVQGYFLTCNVALFLSDNPFVFLGIIIAGIVVFLIRERPCTHTDIDMMHRISIVFFIFGLLGLLYIGLSISSVIDSTSVSVILVLSEIAILCGFNLFDFSGLVHSIGFVGRYRTGLTLLVDGGRVAAYASLFLGLMLGRILTFGASTFGDGSIVLLCSISIAVLVVTVLISAVEQGGLYRAFAPAPYQNKENELETVNNDGIGNALDMLCNSCPTSETCLTRTTIIESMRVATCEPKLENNTVPVSVLENEQKADNYNIVEGTTVSSAECTKVKSVIEKRLVGEASSSTRSTTHHALTSVQQETIAASARVNTENYHSGSGDQSLHKSATELSKRDSSKRGSTQQEETFEVKTPWRDACREIIDLYHLSPRESEIFYIIAKGRNADYVQKELVISIHTAKTHIANIYHKLGVHSAQEMLSLIDTFRDKNS